MREIKRFIVNITMVDSIYKDMLCVGLYICMLSDILRTTKAL